MTRKKRRLSKKARRQRALRNRILAAAAALVVLIVGAFLALRAAGRTPDRAADPALSPIDMAQENGEQGQSPSDLTLTDGEPAQSPSESTQENGELAQSPSESIQDDSEPAQSLSDSAQENGEPAQSPSESMQDDGDSAQSPADSTLVGESDPYAAWTGPDVLSFYQPEGKANSPRRRLGDTFSAPWKKGKDIASFEVIASDAEQVTGKNFIEMFGRAWVAFPGAENCRIGYTVRYALDDGQEIKFSLIAPQHIQQTDYLECWIYDDVHQTPGKFYSHLRQSRMKSDTLITSIKLTCGSKIEHVTDIWLRAFVYTSADDFDADRNYIGPTACEVHIVRG